jgi:hypothetical protein
MKSRHVVFWLKAVLVLGAFLAATVNIMCQRWISERIDLLFIDSSSSRSSSSISTAGMEKMMTANRSSLNSAGLWDGEFKHHKGVVIATKIHGPHQWGLLQQSLCLLHFAYNKRVKYDIVVFSSEPIPAGMLQSIKSLLAPAKVTVALDNRGLKEEIAALSPSRYKSFLNKCRDHILLNSMEINTDSETGIDIGTDTKVLLDDQSILQNLTWYSDCGDGRLAYNWQAEFRSRHIWHHPALAKYKWMMWMDTDSFCTKPWQRDPVALAIRNDLAIFFDNYHGGGSRNLARAIAKGFHVSLCQSRLTGLNLSMDFFILPTWISTGVCLLCMALRSFLETVSCVDFLMIK